MSKLNHGPDVVCWGRPCSESDEHPTVMLCLMDRGCTAILEGVERARSAFEQAPGVQPKPRSKLGIANSETDVCETKQFSGQECDLGGFDWI